MLSASASAPATPLDWSALSAQLGMGYANFRKRFTQLAGVSPGRYRMRCVMRRACELMRDPELRAKEVARRCGFSNPFHFSRQFKQVVGISPSQFRNTSAARLR